MVIAFPSLTGCGAVEDIGLGLKWDSATLAGEVHRRAALLSQMGIGRGSLVAIAHSGSALFFADLFAVWTVGATAACLDSRLTASEFQTVVDFAKPVAILIDGGKTSGAVSVPVLELANVARSQAPTIAAKPSLDDAALVLFTSGTTGAPKGVVLSFRALLARIELNAGAIGSHALKRALVTLPTHFGHGLIGNALTPLMTGGDIVLYPLGISLGGDLGRIIDRHGITFMTSVPALWRIAKKASQPPSGNSLIRVHVGSAPISAQLLAEIAAWSRAEVVNCYGMTETSNWIAGASSRTDGIADGLVGKPWGGVAAVMDNEGNIQATGEGEILLQSPSLMSGYLDRPDLTAAAMFEGWLRTGDRGTIDDLGRIRLTGRIKDEINRAGFKVQPAELDMMLETHPGIAEACVFAVPDSIAGETVAAAIRLQAGAKPSIDSLRSWCNERIRREAIPEHWFVVDQLPRNARGKINRAELGRILAGTTDADGSRAIEHSDPDQATNAGRRVSSRTEGSGNADIAARVRDAVKRAWTKVLNRRSFEADVPMDDAGGDSLGALNLLFQLEKELMTQIPLELIKANITPSQLISALQTELETPADSVVVDRTQGQLPQVFLMPSAHGDAPILTEFRKALDGRLRFVVIQYPQLNEMIDAGATFNVLVDAAVSQILSKCGDTCLLAGYSFGGFVAWETARRLTESGRRVAFLGLIDSRAAAPSRQRRNVFFKMARWLHPINIYYDAMFWFVQLSPPWLLRQAGSRVRLPARAAFVFQSQLVALLRGKALRMDVVRPLQLPTTLFRSDEYFEVLPDHGWGDLAKKLVVLPVGGDHLTMLQPPFQQSLCDKFMRAVSLALSDSSNQAPAR